MKNLKIVVLVVTVCVTLSSMVFAATLVNDVYFSNFKIKLNGSEYIPQMPVLNYLGRTYLALREFGTVTGNEIDFVNNEILINNEEQPKRVIQKDIVLNGNKHNVQIKYYYNDNAQREYVPVDILCVQGKKAILLDNKVVTTWEGNLCVEDYEETINDYVITELYSKKEYLVLSDYIPEGAENIYYIISEEGNVLLSAVDMSNRAYASASVINSNYKHAQGNLYNELCPEITKDSLQMCYPMSAPEQGWISEGINWYRVKYTIRNGALHTNIIKEYEPSQIQYTGAT